MAWADFKKERPVADKVFRAFAVVSDYYNFEFSDQKDNLLSVNLLSPDGVESLHGYCERRSELGGMLPEIFGNREGTAGITVKLAFPEKAESNHCVKITDLVSDRWLILP